MAGKTVTGMNFYLFIYLFIFVYVKTNNKVIPTSWVVKEKIPTPGNLTPSPPLSGLSIHINLLSTGVILFLSV